VSVSGVSEAGVEPWAHLQTLHAESKHRLPVSKASKGTCVCGPPVHCLPIICKAACLAGDTTTPTSHMSKRLTYMMSPLQMHLHSVSLSTDCKRLSLLAVMNGFNCHMPHCEGACSCDSTLNDTAKSFESKWHLVSRVLRAQLHATNGRGFCLADSRQVCWLAGKGHELS
jgi:hypothetical protein